MTRSTRIARVRAEQGDAQAFRLMQAQAMAVGQRRIEPLNAHRGIGTDRRLSRK